MISQSVQWWLCIMQVMVSPGPHLLPTRPHLHEKNNIQAILLNMPSVLCRCWLGGRKGIRPVKNWVVGFWRGCLGRGADLHIAQQMPLPLTISCSSKSRLVLIFLVLPFWYLLTRVVPDMFQKSSKAVVYYWTYCKWSKVSGQTRDLRPWCSWRQLTHSWSRVRHRSHPWRTVVSACSDAVQRSKPMSLESSHLLTGSRCFSMTSLVVVHYTRIVTIDSRCA